MNVPILGPGNVPILGEHRTKEPQIRLMLCRVCKVIEEIPDYEGDPEYDTLLQVCIDRHTDAFGTPHTGNLFKVPLKWWSKSHARKKIIEQINEGIQGGLANVDKDFYDAKSTFHEDAMKCFQQHQRPKGACMDYRSDSKKLLPKTNADRKELGLQPVNKAPVHTYLCQFCPVHVFMVTKEREKRNLYK